MLQINNLAQKQFQTANDALQDLELKNSRDTNVLFGEPIIIGIAQNKPRSQIQGHDLTSRTFHVDMHADLHDTQNSRLTYSSPQTRNKAQNQFNWMDPS